MKPLLEALQKSVENFPRVNAGNDLEISSVGGGCISQAFRVQTVGSNGAPQVWFAKINEASFLDNFEAEIEGLRLLAETRTIRVPRAHGAVVAGDRAVLVCDWIDRVDRSPNRAAKQEFFRHFGQQLAELHRASLGTRIGLDRDNYLGAARQINRSQERWVDFVAEARLGYQLAWARQQKLADGPLTRDVQQVIDRLDDLLAGRAEETCLLHGDLWSGNYLRSSDGSPAIIDPAVYYGCREAEFGMLLLFGGCPEAFYEAYTEAWPLADGWQRRARIYVLYHLLNHLNLFGGAYAAQCRQVAAAMLR